MDFGVVLQTDPPASRTVELTRMAEDMGFSHAWTFDSHILWQEAFVLYPAMLAATSKIVVGPMVTNPATRDWTVLASSFATLRQMYGDRVVCGIGRGDSAVRTINGRPSTLATLREAVHVIRELGSGRPVEHNGVVCRLPWSDVANLEVWVAAYGPQALRLAGETADGFILQLADPDIAAWMIGEVRAAAVAAGRDPDALTFCVAAPAYVGDWGDPAARAHMREQCRWFGGMVGNHVASIVSRYGHGTSVPTALTEYVAGRQGYDYAEHGRVGNSHTGFVPDGIVDRFCLLGGPEEHVSRLSVLRELGVNQFAIYLQHDNQVGTLRAYGGHIIPALALTATASPGG